MSRKRRGLLGRSRRPSRTSSLPPGEETATRAPESAPPAPEPTSEPGEQAPMDVGYTPTIPAVQPAPPPEIPAAPPEELPAPPEELPAPPVAEETVEDEPAAPVRSLAPGDVLGQWVITSALGESQQCQLFRARHKNTERIRVLLKVRFPDDSPTPPDLVHEGELLFALKHPNVASVRNLKLTHDPPYLEMDELPGDRLDTLLSGRQIFMAQALDLVEQLLGALVYLHARGVYHRDIQPANIVVRQNGALSLMGFAYSIRGDAERAHPLTALGYLQPEWPAVHDPGQVDLYAVGCLLYELLTGKAPFDAPRTGTPLTQALVIRRKRTAPFLDPGERFHEDLRAIVRMLTSLESRARFPTAATALGRLQRVERSYST